VCVATSQAAALHHERTCNSYQYALPLQDLVKRYEAKDQKCDELRSKFTTTKATLSARERELEAAQRVLHNSAAEKKQLKVNLFAQVLSSTTSSVVQFQRRLQAKPASKHAPHQQQRSLQSRHA
jgi:hypothetical protein